MLNLYYKAYLLYIFTSALEAFYSFNFNDYWALEMWPTLLLPYITLNMKHLLVTNSLKWQILWEVHKRRQSCDFLFGCTQKYSLRIRHQHLYKSLNRKSLKTIHFTLQNFYQGSGIWKLNVGSYVRRLLHLHPLTCPLSL